MSREIELNPCSLFYHEPLKLETNLLYLHFYNKPTGLDKHFLRIKLLKFSYPSVLTFVLGAQKNRLIETVLLSTYNICFG